MKLRRIRSGDKVVRMIHQGLPLIATTQQEEAL